jgi:hypothetical protein
MRSDSWQRILARRDEITRLAAEEDARIVAEGRAAIASMKARAR